ncbi:odorant receptor 85b-like [Choristoneura fumiferana]|uniref:odorant receptor 85b-like n=1 Tax=Choristoneura fumiferana TaxID=7141 RepID=UPI003D15B138
MKIIFRKQSTTYCKSIGYFIEMKSQINEIPKPKYKSFDDTFKLCSFALAVGLLYPNKRNLLIRAILFICVLLFHFWSLFWYIWYTTKCLVKLDIYNSTRNITLGIIIVLFLFKTVYVNLKTATFAEVLKQITKDLLKGNDMEEDYQDIYDYFIKQGKLGQSFYVFIPSLLSFMFPIYSGIAMVGGSLKNDNFTKYMVHEMDLKYVEDKQYDSPYFELIFAYYSTASFILLPNYVGFDGSFCIVTSHLRLKLKLISHSIQRAFQDSSNTAELKARLNNCIKDHQEALDFYVLIQKMYGGWLFAVFLLTSFLISCNLYQIYLVGIDPKYTLFAFTGVFHMYTPCHFASSLIAVGEEISTEIYCAKWESWEDPAITKLIIFIIARSQKTLLLTGLNIVVFNMNSFVSLMQTSYSFFTLITR